MGSSRRNAYEYPESNFQGKTETLNNWIRNFRLKKISLKRRNRGDLRMSAILTMALHTAEEELRRKQQERAQKWSMLQTKISASNNSWQSLNLSSCDNENHLNNNSISNRNSSICNGYYVIGSGDDDVAEEIEKRQRDIENLWNSELSGLDSFINSLSQVKTSIVR